MCLTGSWLSCGLRIGAVMARHRRPFAVETPAELTYFSEGDWPGSGEDAFRCWKEARRAFAAEHPDSTLGSVLDQLRFERWMRRFRAGCVQS
jgi:hypothetical protein